MKQLLTGIFLVAICTLKISAQQWTTSGANIYNSNTGNVGIGTISPVYKLHINGSLRGGGFILDNGATYGSSDPLFYNAGLSNPSTNYAFTQNATGTTGINGSTLHIRTSNITRMFVDVTGNIGIGTNTPQSKLQITGDGSAVGPIITIQNWIGAGLVGGLHFASGNGSYNWWSGIEAYATGGTDQQDLRFSTTYGTRNERMRILQTGEVGIATTTPGAPLQVGSSVSRGFKVYSNTGPNGTALIGDAGGWAVGYNFEGNAGTALGGFGAYGNSNTLGNYFIGSYASQSMTILSSGNVGIGTTTPNTNAKLDVNGNIFTNSKILIGTTDLVKVGSYALAVNGDAIFNKAKVKLYTTWPDFVFEEKYGLLPLENVEKFIKANKHLPDVPNAADVEKDGIDLGSTQIILLQKIEELTLYAIEQNKNFIEQNKKSAAQQEQINSLIKELETIKTQQKK